MESEAHRSVFVCTSVFHNVTEQVFHSVARCSKLEEDEEGDVLVFPEARRIQGFNAEELISSQLPQGSDLPPGFHFFVLASHGQLRMSLEDAAAAQGISTITFIRSCTHFPEDFRGHGDVNNVVMFTFDGRTLGFKAEIEEAFAVMERLKSLVQDHVTPGVQNHVPPRVNFLTVFLQEILMGCAWKVGNHLFFDPVYKWTERSHTTFPVAVITCGLLGLFSARMIPIWTSIATSVATDRATLSFRQILWHIVVDLIFFFGMWLGMTSLLCQLVWIHFRYGFLALMALQFLATSALNRIQPGSRLSGALAKVQQVWIRAPTLVRHSLQNSWTQCIFALESPRQVLLYMCLVRVCRTVFKFLGLLLVPVLLPFRPCFLLYAWMLRFDETGPAAAPALLGIATVCVMLILLRVAMAAPAAFTWRSLLGGAYGVALLGVGSCYLAIALYRHFLGYLTLAILPAIVGVLVYRRSRRVAGLDDSI